MPSRKLEEFDTDTEQSYEKKLYIAQLMKIVAEKYNLGSEIYNLDISVVAKLGKENGIQFYDFLKYRK